MLSNGYVPTRLSNQLQSFLLSMLAGRISEGRGQRIADVDD